MPSAVFEPPITASEWLQTHDLDCAANGICFVKMCFKICNLNRTKNIQARPKVGIQYIV